MASRGALGSGRGDLARRAGPTGLHLRLALPAAAAVALLAAPACGSHDDGNRPRPFGVRDGELPRPTGPVVLDPPPHAVFTPFAPTVEDARRVGDLIARFVEDRTGLRVIPEVASSYDDVEARILDGRATFALLAPLVYVRVTDAFEADPALRSAASIRLILNSVSAGSPTYVGYVVAAADTKVAALAGVDGMRFGMVDGSCSGYLFPLDLVAARGLDVAEVFRNVRFFNGHSEVAAELLRPRSERLIDAGALYDHIVDVLPPSGRSRLRVLAKTARIPRDTVVARIPIVGGREDPATLAAAAAFQHAMLLLDSYPDVAYEVRAGLGFDGWIVGDDRRYGALRDIYRRFSHYQLVRNDATFPGTQ